MHLTLFLRRRTCDSYYRRPVRAEVSRLTGIPKEHLGTVAETQTATKHSEVKEFLENTVFGQAAAIEKVTDSITISMAGLKDPNKPIASYLFTGRQV